MTRTVTKLVGGAIAALAVTLALPTVALMAAADTAAQPTPTSGAVDDIPAVYLTLYLDAAAERCPTVTWTVLAAIGKVESDHGRIHGAHTRDDGRVTPPIIGPALDGTDGTRRIADTDDGRYDRDRQLDRAVGPMQFLPGTWKAYGIDASGDRIADPHNAYDAVHSAAAYLCDAGAHRPERLRQALYAYNRSTDYVDRVLMHAAHYGQATPHDRVPASPELITAVLANPRLDIYDAGRRDIAAGRVDARILTLLQALSLEHVLGVSSLKTGHSRCVGGDHGQTDCTVSEHWYGRAVDIHTVDGRPVAPTNLAARRIVERLAALEARVRPSEVGSPWPDFDHLPGFFHDNQHLDHLHLAAPFPRHRPNH